VLRDRSDCALVLSVWLVMCTALELLLFSVALDIVRHGMVNNYARVMFGVLICVLFFIIAQLFVYGLLLQGVHTRKSVKILPGLIWMTIIIILSSIGSIGSIIFKAAVVHYAYIFTFLFWIPLLVLDVYIWKILQTEYLSIKDIENQRPEEVELGNANGPVSHDTTQHCLGLDQMNDGKQNNCQNRVQKNGVLEKWRNREVVINEFFSPWEQDNVQNGTQSPPPYSRLA